MLCEREAEGKKKIVFRFFNKKSTNTTAGKWQPGTGSACSLALF